MAHKFSGADDRASTPTKGDDPADAAPEIDHAVQAPQRGRDRAGPEVVPGLGSQVYYNTSPPEAIVDNSVETVSEITVGKEASSARKPRRILIITILAVLLLVTIALSVGLGVGLKQQKRDVAPPASSNFSSSDTTTSTAARPSATAGFSAHGVRSNTSLAAVTLANGNRHVYFQETAGGLRRAMYSSRSNQWQMSAGGFSVLGAKNDTPLAAAMLKSRTDNTINVNLIYVSPENEIRCRAWYETGVSECLTLSEFPKTLVAPESRQITFDVVSYDVDRMAVLLSYENPNHLIVVMFGYIDYTEDTGHWYWEDYTHKLNRLLSSRFEDNQLNFYISHPCSSHPTSQGPMSDTVTLICFTTGNRRAYFNLTYFSTLDINNLTINEVVLREGVQELVDSPDVVLLAPGSDGTAPPAITLNGSRFVIDEGHMKAPDSPFPFQHLASTWDNATASYLYHQLDDLTLVQDMWDGGISRFWISNNITIGTTISETFQESEDSNGIL